MKVALVCIAKNEDLYIQEWIDYHLKLGFDKIFIYQNNWVWKGENSSVVKIKWDGKRMQIAAYNHFLETQSEYKWAAFIDVDEFIVLKKHKNIKNFIQDYDEFESIGINWVLFGSNNLSYPKDSDFSVIKRFTKRQSKVNSHIKSIVKVKKGLKFSSPHEVKLSWVDTNFNLKKGPYNNEGTDDIAQINHYFCKTKEEFINKINRGRATTSTKRTIESFSSYDTNEVEDLHAYNFMYNDNNSILNS